MGDLVQGIGIDRRMPVLTGRGMFTLPDRAVGAAVSCSNTANTYGSWATVSPDGQPWDLFIHGVQVGYIASTVSDESTWQMQIGLGPAPVEVVISTLKLEAVQITTAESRAPRNATWLPFPIFVPAYSRIAIRAAHNTTTAPHTREISLNVCRTRDESVAS